MADKEDAHVKIYKKEFHEVKYLDVKCPICNNRIDEYGYCSCGSGDS